MDRTTGRSPYLTMNTSSEADLQHDSIESAEGEIRRPDPNVSMERTSAQMQQETRLRRWMARLVAKEAELDKKRLKLSGMHEIVAKAIVSGRNAYVALSASRELVRNTSNQNKTNANALHLALAAMDRAIGAVDSFETDAEDFQKQMEAIFSELPVVPRE